MCKPVLGTVPGPVKTGFRSNLINECYFKLVNLLKHSTTDKKLQLNLCQND